MRIPIGQKLEVTGHLHCRKYEKSVLAEGSLMIWATGRREILGFTCKEALEMMGLKACPDCPYSQNLPWPFIRKPLPFIKTTPIGPCRFGCRRR